MARKAIKRKAVAKPKAGPAPTTKPPAAVPPPPEAYDRVPRVGLTATDETLWLTRYDERGQPSVTYPVTAAAAAMAFRGLAGAGTGLLPPGTLFWEKGEGAARLAIWLPPATHTLNWASGKRETRIKIPLPGLVFVGAGHQYHVFAAKDRPASEQDSLYQAPLSNVSGDGNICFGNVQYPACGPATIGLAAALFLESNFNEHLSAGRVNDDGRVPLLEVLRGLEGLAEFPPDYLRPAHMTLGGLLYGHRGYVQIGNDGDDGDPDEDEEFADGTFMGDGEEFRDELADDELEMELA